MGPKDVERVIVEMEKIFFCRLIAIEVQAAQSIQSIDTESELVGQATALNDLSTVNFALEMR